MPRLNQTKRRSFIMLYIMGIVSIIGIAAVAIVGWRILP
nr:MAG TPA: vesicle-associated membrane protein 2 [Caudoviricetes sp.]